MKKTFTINIGGVIFNIDEDAFEILKKYLSDIETRLKNSEGGTEIIKDIEARIAELLKEKIQGKEVVDINDVNEIIETMGNPSDFEDEETEYHEAKQEQKSQYQTGKRLYRNTDDRVLGGVCSGLGSYFGIDPIIFRILFFVTIFTFGFGPLLYLALWIAVPPAITTAQKLEMKGEAVNIENIEKAIKDEYEEVKSSFKKSQTIKEGKKYAHKTGNTLTEIFKAFGRIFAVIFGIIITGIGIALLIGFSAGFLFDGPIYFNGHTDGVALSSFLQIFMDTSEINFIYLAGFLVIGIPLLSLIYAGVKIIFNIKTQSKIIGLTGFIFWIMGLLFAIYISVSHLNNYKLSGKNTTGTELPKKHNTFYIEANNSLLKRYDYIEDFNIIVNENKPDFFGIAKFDITKSSGNKPIVSIEKTSRGENIINAETLARKISYNWSIQDSLITFDSHFAKGLKNKYRGQDININIKLPEGYIVYLDNSLEYIIHDIENTVNELDYYMLDKKWIMTDAGLEPYQEKIN